jgi:predicted GIY-YIG superfamily endonuclease
MRSFMETRTVYILRSLTNPDRHYTGRTSNATRRLAWHNAGLNTHTARHRPWQLLVSMEFNNHAIAARFERYLKTGSGRAFARRHFG